MSMDFEENAALLKRISERIKDEIYRVIATQGLHERGAYNPDVADRYDDTWEAHGYTVVINAVFMEQLAILMRLWDKRDHDDVLSIRRAKKILGDANFLDWFIRNERNNPGTYTPDQREELIRENLTKFNDAYNHAKGHHTLGRLRSIRNEMLAHNAEKSVGQKAEWGYADDLLEMTIPIAEAVNIIAFSHGFDGKGLVGVWATYADRFWTAAIKGIPE